MRKRQRKKLRKKASLETCCKAFAKWVRRYKYAIRNGAEP